MDKDLEKRPIRKYIKTFLLGFVLFALVLSQVLSSSFSHWVELMVYIMGVPVVIYFLFGTPFRYVFCVLLAFLSAAWALSLAIAAYCSLGIHVVFGDSGGIYMRHTFYQSDFQWMLIPVAVSLTVCLVA